jgi:hypothetical protein
VRIRPAAASEAWHEIASCGSFGDWGASQATASQRYGEGMSPIVIDRGAPLRNALSLPKPADFSRFFRGNLNQTKKSTLTPNLCDPDVMRRLLAETAA